MNDALLWVTAVANVCLAGAAFWGLRQASAERKEAHELAAKEREAAERAARGRFELERVLCISEEFEKYKSNVASATVAASIRANLHALPVRYLPGMRHYLGVRPDQREATWYASLGDTRDEKLRDEIATLLANLTGAGTSQDFEPVGSPNGDRPRIGPGVNQPE